MSKPQVTRDHDGRPRWSVSQAAKRAGVARSTIQRYLARGAMPGAYLDENGVWSIGVEDLLGAGFRVDAPTPAEGTAHGPQRGRADVEAGGAAHPAEDAEIRRRIAELESELAEARRRADVAEAVARERSEQITDLRRTVAALEAGLSDRVPREPAAPPAPPAPASPRPRGLFGRVADRWGL